MNRGIEVELLSNFSTIRETLERMGIANQKKKMIYPSCYLLSKKGKYYIIHFKNLFYLDGRKDAMQEEDTLRQTAVAMLLEKWGLVKIVNRDNLPSPEECPFIFVLPFAQKEGWTIVHKYTIGNVKNENQAVS